MPYPSVPPQPTAPPLTGPCPLCEAIAPLTMREVMVRYAHVWARRIHDRAECARVLDMSVAALEVLLAEPETRAP